MNVKKRKLFILICFFLAQLLFIFTMLIVIDLVVNYNDDSLFLSQINNYNIKIFSYTFKDKIITYDFICYTFLLYFLSFLLITKLILKGDTFILQPDKFLLIIFMFTFSLDLVKIIIWYSVIKNLEQDIVYILNSLMIFSHIIGVVFFFLSSVYSFSSEKDIDFEHILIPIIVSFWAVYLTPLSSFENENFFYFVFNKNSFQISIFFILALSIFNCMVSKISLFQKIINIILLVIKTFSFYFFSSTYMFFYCFLLFIILILPFN